MQCGAKRYNELSDLVSKSIPYFSKVYKENYLSLAKNITSYPTFLFHNGEGFSNRYNVGFISASQEKFSTYPDIFPLIHEIGHRWLGEWTLWIDDGKPGAYFIKESLNEFMTLMFIRDNLGKELYKKHIEEYRNEYQEIKNARKDAPIIEVTTNTNNTVIYRKGPLLLDHIAQKIGYQNLIEVISRFYQCYANKKPLHYNDFIEVLSDQYPDAGKELDDLIKK